MTSWERLWLLSLTFGVFLLFATLLETQGALGSGRFAAILMNVSGIGLPFLVVAVELTRSYRVGHFVWFFADWLIYSLLCFLCLALIRVLRRGGSPE